MIYIYIMDNITISIYYIGPRARQDLRPSRLRGGVAALVLSAHRGRGAYFFVADTRGLEELKGLLEGLKG